MQLIFWGIVEISVASVIVHKDESYGVLLRSGTVTLPVINIMLGIAITLLGFLGCCGAENRQPLMLKVYAALVFVFLVSELVMGVVFLVFMSAAKSVTAKWMDYIFDNYGKPAYLSLTYNLDVLQQY
ncbi:hypothetical protein SK128_005878, partial [Halocaridina rubra]